MTLSQKRLAEMRVRVEKSMAYGSDLNAMHLAADNMELQTAVEKLRDALETIYNGCECTEMCIHSDDMQVTARSALLEVFGPSEGGA